MKSSINTQSKKSVPKSLQGSVINNDLKKYQTHPIVLKKMEQAIEILKKVGYM